jgi:hypothetical protein
MGKFGKDGVIHEVPAGSPRVSLEKFQSVKIVSAGEITQVVAGVGCYVQTDILRTDILLEYQPGMTARYTPVVGDFWVVYEGGYASISPRETFLAGYKPVAGTNG